MKLQQIRKKNRAVFNVVLKNIKFLARQGLALRGDGDEFNSNFIQLLHLTGFPGVNIKDWLDRKANKYTSPEVQNECVQLRTLHILGELSQKIGNSYCYSIMTDECTD